MSLQYLKALKYAYLSNGRIVYRPRIKPPDRTWIDTDKQGFLKPPIRLGSPKDSQRAILRAYLAAETTVNNLISAERHTLKWMVEEYKKSSHFRNLAAGSQKRAETLENILDQKMIVDGHDTTLGAMSISIITKPTVRRVADKRLESYRERGYDGRAAVNREITFLSTAAKWALENVDQLGITENPFRISKFPEDARERYVEDNEYQIQTKVAGEMYDYLPVLFEITYLVASRGVETLDIKLSDIDPDRETGGIFINRRKGSRSNFIEWSDRLYTAYLAARELHKKHKVAAINAPLIVSSRGKTLTRSGLDSAMQRLKRKMKEMQLDQVFWTLHDLKRKGMSDAQDDRIAGHKSEQMRERYKVKTERRKPAR